MLKNLLPTLLLAAPLLLISPSRGEDNWPQFRGPTGQGLAAAIIESDIGCQWN